MFLLVEVSAAPGAVATNFRQLFNPLVGPNTLALLKGLTFPQRGGGVPSSSRDPGRIECHASDHLGSKGGHPVRMPCEFHSLVS